MCLHPLFVSDPEDIYLFALITAATLLTWALGGLVYRRIMKKLGTIQRAPQMVEGLARQNSDWARKFELDIEKKFGLIMAEMAKLDKDANANGE